MQKRNLFIIVFLCLSCVLASADTMVTVVGYGTSRGQAVKDALRNAVEQGVGVKVFSSTEVKDFVALKDVMISESFGLVTKYEIISEQNKGAMQGWEVKVKAWVTKDVKSQWAKMQIILEQKGRPSIMFCIKETLDGQELPSSNGEYQLVQKFNHLGFKVIDRQDSQKTRNLQKQLYGMDQNMQGVVAVASQRGADLLIVGMLEGNFTRYIEMFGDTQRLLHSYNFRTKVIRTDTSQVISAVVKPYTTQRESTFYTKESAGKAGFAQIIRDQYLQQMITDIIKAWIRDVQQGTDMTLVISNIKFRQRRKIIAKLGELPDLISAVRPEHYRNRRLQLSIKSKLNAEELAEKMEEIPGLPLEVVELKKNYLEVAYVNE